MSKEMKYQGRVVSIVERNGGWSTILDGMKQLKVRNGELSEVTESKKPAQPKSSAKPKADKPAKAKKPSKDTEIHPTANDGRLVKPDLSRYTVTPDIKTPSGRKAIDIADPVATALRGKDLADAYREAAAATGQTQKGLRERYEHLNPGMQRMNLGNLIRGAASKAAKEQAKAAK